MFERNQLTGISLIKRCTWLGTKWLFWSLVAIILLVWIAFIALIVYRSVELGVSPIEILRIVDSDPNRIQTLYFGSSVATLILLSLGTLLVCIFWGAIVFALIGVAAAIIGKFRRRG